jgi:hypothetical protein
MSGGALDFNFAGNLGGGLYVGATVGTATLTGVSVRWNDAANKGGGFYLNTGTLVLNSIILAGNTSATGAGGARKTGSTPTINDPQRILDPVVRLP